MPTATPTRKKWSKSAAVARLNTWQRELWQQGKFNFDVPPFDWIYTSQAARALGMSDDSVIALCDQGDLEDREVRVKGKRRERQISRRSILLYELRRRNTDPRDLVEKHSEFLDAVKDRDLLCAMRAAIDRRLERNGK